MEESITKRKHGRPLKEKPKDGRYSGQYPSKGSSQTSFDYEFKKDGKNSFELLNVDDLECPICIEMVTEPIRLRCNHLLCRECFEKLVELSSRKCPKCRTWIGGTRQISNLLDTSLWNFIRKKFIHDQIESDRLLALDLVRKERRELYFRFRRESYVLRSSINKFPMELTDSKIAEEIDSQKRKASSDVNYLQDALKEEVKISVENRNAIDSTEPTESKIDKIDSKKIEAKKSVEIAIDSIEPSETKRAKIDSKSEETTIDIKIEPELCSDQNSRSNQKSSNTDKEKSLQVSQVKIKQTVKNLQAWNLERAYWKEPSNKRKIYNGEKSFQEKDDSTKKFIPEPKSILKKSSMDLTDHLVKDHPDQEPMQKSNAMIQTSNN